MVSREQPSAATANQGIIKAMTVETNAPRVIMRKMSIRTNTVHYLAVSAQMATERTTALMGALSATLDMKD